MRTACPICREEHEPRGLSYDGYGVNECGIYRTRAATFTKDANRELLGPMFAAAPDMLAAIETAIGLSQVHDPSTGHFKPVDPYELHRTLFGAMCRAKGIGQ